MRIITTGAVVFVIWSFFSTWLYVDVLRHAARKPVIEQPAPEIRNASADSLAKLYAMMPKDLMIYFEFDKFRLKPDPQFETSLGDFKSWLEKYPGSVLLLTGHTDLVGSPEYNMELGLKRAGEVQKYLEAKGFPAARIKVVSKGRQEPAAGYITPEDRAKNRRVVISIQR